MSSQQPDPSPSTRRDFLVSSAVAGSALVAGLEVAGSASSTSAFAQEKVSMSAQQKAEALGIKFEKQQPGYLNKCVRSGNLLITSGHTSAIKGKLGADLKVEQGAAAARECTIEILKSVWNTHGTLDGLKVLKVLGCVNCTGDFIDQPKVINGCSDLLHELYGKETDGYHARSALGFASLPNGVAVEIEAIFEVKG
jgi:enamine deaminase RidA (YjgF/YER057c/UK114 family)